MKNSNKNGGTFMKKIVRNISVIAMGIAMLIPTTAFASNDSGTTFISSERLLSHRLKQLLEVQKAKILH